MIARLLIAGVAIGALAFAGGATAKVRHHAKAHGTSGAAYTYAAPAQPIPYSDIDHYLHASRAERQSMETAAANSSATNAAAETAAPAATEPPAAPAPTDATPPATSPPTSAAPPATEPSAATPPPSESPPMTPPPATQPPAPPQ
ncbi:MAG TPA: hypothetical protein VG227_00440 [Caulobacteraceae bacterium]|nr:hypothetical protein [Caulobacteraceae bacterium]